MMNKAEKIVTMIVASVGGGAGLWGAYTSYDASKFTQPFDEREQIVKSFTTQIGSAEKRKDIAEVNRVRLLLEKYEESWRSARKLAKLVEPLESLKTTKLSERESHDIRELLDSWSKSEDRVSISPKTLGAAYYVAGNYQQAINQLSLVSANTNDPSVNVLKAVSFAELASSEFDQEVATAHQASAFDFFLNAKKEAPNKNQEILEFSATSDGLKKLLEEKGIELTRP